jgi:hypothetical protein
VIGKRRAIARECRIESSNPDALTSKVGFLEVSACFLLNRMLNLSDRVREQAKRLIGRRFVNLDQPDAAVLAVRHG